MSALFESIHAVQELLKGEDISTRLSAHEDAAGVIRRQGGKLDDRYILDWPKRFELALDDSPLINEFAWLRRPVDPAGG